MWRFDPPSVPAAAVIYTVAMGVVATFFPMYLTIAAIERIGAAKASLIALTSPVAALALAALLFGETLHGVQWLGAAVVLGSIMASVRLGI